MCMEQPGASAKGAVWPFPASDPAPALALELSLCGVVLSTLQLVPKGPPKSGTEGMEGKLGPDSHL